MSSGQMANWTLIHTARDRQEAELLRGMLESNDIHAIITDQRSSVYPMMGNIELLVDRDDVLRALHVMGDRTDL
ncbi:MAG: DUF2007 domain-containing protein [Flavobacteriales bacterium]|nr:DUF2007 domain-containing protein [Flavobacteriales bacterium]MBP6642505.1 DUF2007 domain-containing protein [Flavobacteriales bacterium]MBP7155489.1 DUF2007 domain-containing protein [Flavobacteriales bacterium]HQV74652.1 DUF2007 domain-containing protein [Flavobacteriales bacterium]HQW40491.1 DUF2007 domain-containing protein [Flavobacteriales bacterium]